LLALTSAGMPRLESVLKRVDFPTLGSPTMPICGGRGHGSLG